eukprot:5108780-Amphidinium_carterae.1
MRTAGLASLLHVDFLKRQSASSSKDAKDEGDTKPTETPPPPPNEPANRWGRRQQERNGDRGWTLVERKPKVEHEVLVDEWSVPVRECIRLNQAGIAMTEDNSVAE